MRNLIWDVLEDYQYHPSMSTFFSADICLARVLAKRARARTCQIADIDRKEMAALQALGWEHGASEKRKSWRQASSARRE